MSLEAALYTNLTEDAGVAAIAEGRVYPVMVPQDRPYPALVYQLISAPRVHSMDGASGLVSARVQITSFAVTQVVARSLADAARVLMDGVSGTWAGVVIDHANLIDEADVLDKAVGADSQRVFGIRQDWMIWYEE